MKRSEINAIIRDGKTFFQRHQFHLPAFVYWSPSDWATKGPEVREVVEHGLGWDITDFGLGDYPHTGLFLFTIRNGTPEALKTGRGKTYAEKAMIVRDHQITPMHFHWSKMEDIINRGGGDLVIQLYNADPNEDLAKTDVTASIDGVVHTVKAGATVTLRPGESISLPDHLYHKFWGERGDVLVGEVSLVNDDNLDNRFHEKVGRFPQIEEDEPPLHLLVNDYRRYYHG